jgi:hypothetical protein
VSQPRHSPYNSSGSASPAAWCRFRDAGAALGCFRTWPSSTMRRPHKGHVSQTQFNI